MAERCQYHCATFFRADGEIRWIDSWNLLSYGDDGSAPRLLSANIDDRHGKVTEAPLKEHKASLADALEAR